MKNIQFQTFNKFGTTSRRTIDGRRLTPYVKHLSLEQGICEYSVIQNYVEKLVEDDVNSDIVFYKFCWVDDFGHKQIIKSWL